MTFIDQPEGDPKQKHKKQGAMGASNPDVKSDANSQNEEKGNHDEPIGLTGGQPIDAEGGLDISQYTGPKSKPSSAFDDPEAEYKMGPGSGLNKRDEKDINAQYPEENGSE